VKETVEELDSREAVANGVTQTIQQNDPRSFESYSESTESVKTVHIRGASGPRSQAGKKRSSRNSLKHGIFSYATVLQGEDRKQYNSLIENLRNDLKPQGTFQEVLVEQLALNKWRLRRLVLAESAEVEKKAAVERFDRWARKQEEAEGPSRRACFGDAGVVTELGCAGALEHCLDLLVDLRARIDREGFNEEKDLNILGTLYASESWKDLGHNLQRIYLTVSEAMQNEGGPSAETGKQAFLHEIDREVRTLKRNAKRIRLVDPDRIIAEDLEHVVLSAPALDLFIRYEAHLERSSERILAQLVRLQEMRSGQPALPPHTEEQSKR
jgi:hypothetical protein